MCDVTWGWALLMRGVRTKQASKQARGCGTLSPPHNCSLPNPWGMLGFLRPSDPTSILGSMFTTPTQDKGRTNWGWGGGWTDGKKNVDLLL